MKHHADDRQESIAVSPTVVPGVTDPLLIEFRNATVWRGSTLVFDRLNLSIPQHQPVAILGPNGSGKTTLLKTINRELYPVAAPDSRVRILGRESWNVWELRQHIGVVSHELQQRYAPHTTAVDVVVSGYFASIGVHGTLADRVTSAQIGHARELLDRLGLADLHAKPLAEMSTGQQRRCLLARALVHDPDTLIFDEPTAGLDLSASFAYLETLAGLSAQGVNIVMVTHHINEILPGIERVIVLKAGDIAADGSRAEVLTDALLSHAYETPVRVAEVDGYFLAYPGRPD